MDTEDPKTLLDYYFAQLDKIKEKYAGVMTDEGWQELEVWVAKQPQDVQDFLDANTGLSPMTPKVQEYKAAQQLLRRYWEANERVKRRYPARWGKIWDEYLTIDDDLKQSNFRRQHSTIIKAMERTRDSFRKAIRRDNPDVGEALLRWGYVTTGITLKELEVKRELLGVQ